MRASEAAVAKTTPHPALAIITLIVGGREKLAKKFLAHLFEAGYHIAPNRKKKDVLHADRPTPGKAPPAGTD